MKQKSNAPNERVRETIPARVSNDPRRGRRDEDTESSSATTRAQETHREAGRRQILRRTWRRHESLEKFFARDRRSRIQFPDPPIRSAEQARNTKSMYRDPLSDLSSTV